MLANKRVLLRETKQGIGSAYKEGFALSKGDLVLIMDADLSHHPKYIKSLLRE